jgi:hypothetical protein
VDRYTLRVHATRLNFIQRKLNSLKAIWSTLQSLLSRRPVGRWSGWGGGARPRLQASGVLAPPPCSAAPSSFSRLPLIAHTYNNGDTRYLVAGCLTQPNLFFCSFIPLGSTQTTMLYTSLYVDSRTHTSTARPATNHFLATSTGTSRTCPHNAISLESLQDVHVHRLTTHAPCN